MSDTSRAKPIDWSLIEHHLQTGAYEAAAAALGEVQLVSAQANDAVAAATVAAIRQICLACHECQVKIACHQQGIAESEQREAALSTHAQALLSQISAAIPLESMEAKMGNGVPAHQDTPTDQYPVQATTHAAPHPVPVTIWTLFWLFLHNLRRQMGLLSDTPAQEGSTFLRPAEIAPGVEPSQAVAPLTLATMSLPTANEPVDGAVDENTMAETQLQFSSLLTEALPDPPVVETAELIAEPATEPITEFTVELTTELNDGTSEAALPPADETEASDTPTAPSLVIYSLGTFQLYQDDQLVEEWPSNKGQLIFKYLLLHRERPVAKEFLMDRFWPDAPPDAARNNLNVAIYGLRRALRRGRPDFSQVLFRDDSYLLNPEMTIWVDAELFIHHIKTGQRLEQASNLDRAMQEYQAAEALYQGEFMQEDRYEDWLLPMRQQVQERYLYVLERLATHYFKQADFEASITIYNKMLVVDSCNEDAHCNLMRCYSQQGRLHLALRQYHHCVEALRHELDVEPSQPIKELYAQLRQQ